MNYYNEIDPFAAAWLAALMDAKHIPYGHIDTRSITDVSPSDLAGYAQCHFFAGIGGWPLALAFAGVPSTVPLWTGSCPCQPFSNAGKRKGTDDERHLWPVWRRLIAKSRPSVVLGEQVASRDGQDWFAGVRSELEECGYAVGGVDLCAAGFGAPHIRQRLYFVGLADTYRKQWNWIGDIRPGGGDESTDSRDACGLADANGNGHQRAESTEPQTDSRRRSPNKSFTDRHRRPFKAHGFWREADWLRCRDGKWRPVEAGTFPMADGIPSRMGRLRGYGNAIVPQVAATFIRAALTA